MVEFFFNPAQPVALGLNALIFTLGLGALLHLSLVGARTVRQEVSALEGLQKRWRDRPSGEELASYAPTTGHIVRRQYQMLLSLQANGQAIDATSVTRLSSARLDELYGFPRFVSSSVVLLGLAGTLIGLGRSISALTITLSGSSMSTEAIRDAILNTLGGMTTAFSTTLAGAAMAFVASAGLAFSRRQQQGLANDLAEFTESELVPRFTTSEVSVLGKSAAQLEAIASMLHQRIDEVLHSMKAGFQELEQDFEDRALGLTERLGEVRDATLQVIGEADSPVTLAQYVAAVKQTTAELERSVAATATLVPALAEQVQAIVATHAAAIQEVLQRHASRWEAAITRQSEAGEALFEASAASTARFTALENLLDNLQKALAGLSQAWTTSHEANLRLRTDIVEAIDGGLREVTKPLAETVEHQSEFQGRTAAALAAFERSHRDTLSAVSQTSDRSFRRVEEILEGVQRLHGEQTASYERRLDALAAQLIASLASEVARLGQELRETVRTPTGAPPAQGRSWDANDRRPARSDGSASQHTPQRDRL